MNRIVGHVYKSSAISTITQQKHKNWIISVMENDDFKRKMDGYNGINN